MLELEETAKAQARQFSHPANHPQTLPQRGPAVTVAQWYTAFNHVSMSSIWAQEEIAYLHQMLGWPRQVLQSTPR